VRDADWAQHSDNTPDTPQNHVCTRCTTAFTGLCGRQTHCAAAPTRQVPGGLAARDLRAAPFNYDANTAFIVANKIFYQGSGNVGSWHSCDCNKGTSNGCGSTNGYMQWLAADDDNGNLNDGTPHMTAIYMSDSYLRVQAADGSVEEWGRRRREDARFVLGPAVSARLSDQLHLSARYELLVNTSNVDTRLADPSGACAAPDYLCHRYDYTNGNYQKHLVMLELGATW
jgi:hypothetical protein